MKLPHIKWTTGPCSLVFCSVLSISGPPRPEDEAFPSTAAWVFFNWKYQKCNLGPSAFKACAFPQSSDPFEVTEGLCEALVLAGSDKHPASLLVSCPGTVVCATGTRCTCAVLMSTALPQRQRPWRRGWHRSKSVISTTLSMPRSTSGSKSPLTTLAAPPHPIRPSKYSREREHNGQGKRSVNASCGSTTLPSLLQTTYCLSL